MHPGLRAPWFGLHLRRGNSLIGGRREVYPPSAQEKKAWLTTVPTVRALGTGLEPGEVHHFLLPAQGWGAVADTKEAKELAPDAVASLKKWRTSMRSALSVGERKRFAALAGRVERLWELSLRRLEIAESEIRRPIGVWEAEPAAGTGAVSREQIEAVLSDLDGAYLRLRRVMDAWAALWFWPVTTDVAPPSRAGWLDGLEALLGVSARGDSPSSRGLFSEDPSWAALDDAEQVEGSFSSWKSVAHVLEEHPWLGVCASISEKEGFFHWELDFAPVFARGGFDLQLGNPPWVRPDWDDNVVLADVDPWFELAEKPPVGAVATRRKRTVGKSQSMYLDERSSLAGLSENLGSEVDRPLLAGLRPDLYRCFMDRTWRAQRSSGVVGLIHPDTHLGDSRAGVLREATYCRLRRHWQFRNELRLFEIHNTREYGVSVYGSPRGISFYNACWLFEPDTIDRSLLHDGSNQEPGIKDDKDSWDVRPHRSRVLRVTRRTLENWFNLVGDRDTPATQTRLMRPLTASGQEVLARIAGAEKLDPRVEYSSVGWDEAADRKRGIFAARSATPDKWSRVILQGPHFSQGNLFARQPNPSVKNNRDYSPINLETLTENAIPRTNYQTSLPDDQYRAEIRSWGGRRSNDFWRLIWRNMFDSSTERSLYAAIIPPGPTHVHTNYSIALKEDQDLALALAVWSSLPVDYLVKVSGGTKVHTDFVRRFPHPLGHRLVPELTLRALRLSCLTADFAPLWQEVHDPAWTSDSWTRDFSSTSLASSGREWSAATPLRRDAERRQLLVEIDALVAVTLEISAEQLCSIYRTQFGVLRKYERAMLMDANGRQVSREVIKEYDKHGARADLGRYELPFTPVDREAEMTIAHEEFSRRLAARQAAATH